MGFHGWNQNRGLIISIMDIKYNLLLFKLVVFQASELAKSFERHFPPLHEQGPKNLRRPVTWTLRTGTWGPTTRWLYVQQLSQRRVILWCTRSKSERVLPHERGQVVKLGWNSPERFGWNTSKPESRDLTEARAQPARRLCAWPKHKQK